MCQHRSQADAQRPHADAKQPFTRTNQCNLSPAGCDQTSMLTDAADLTQVPKVTHRDLEIVEPECAPYSSNRLGADRRMFAFEPVRKLGYKERTSSFASITLQPRCALPGNSYPFKEFSHIARHLTLRSRIVPPRSLTNLVVPTGEFLQRPRPARHSNLVLRNFFAH